MAYTKEENRINIHYKEALDEIEKLNELIKRRNEEIRNLKSKVSKLETEIITKTSDEDLVKDILSLYAKNNSFTQIFENIKFKGYKDTTLEYIKEICTNIEDLEPTIINYFKEQEEAYIKSIKNNPDIYSDLIMKNLKVLYNSLEVELHKAESADEKRKIISEMKGLLSEMNKGNKNIVDSEKDVLGLEIVNSKTDKLEQANQTLAFVVQEEFVN